MKNLVVENVENKGRAVANQFLISWEENGIKFELFQSYSSPIILWKNGVIWEVGADWDYSRTTGKYRNLLTYTTKKQFEKMLKTSFVYDKENEKYIRKDK